MFSQRSRLQRQTYSSALDEIFLELLCASIHAFQFETAIQLLLPLPAKLALLLLPATLDKNVITVLSGQSSVLPTNQRFKRSLGQLEKIANSRTHACKGFGL